MSSPTSARAQRVRRALARAITREDQDELSRDGSKVVRYALAKNVDLDPGVLTVLSTDPSKTVREKVALNPTLPEALQEQLAQDKADTVRARLANNPSLVPAVGLELSRDVSGQVRDGLYANPYLALSDEMTVPFLRSFHRGRRHLDSVLLTLPLDVAVTLGRDWEGSLTSLRAACLSFSA